MSKSKKIILSVLFLLIVLCTLLSISYAYYKYIVSFVKNNVTTSVPDCVNLSLTNEGSSVALTGDYSAPMSDTKALTSINNRFELTVTNTCTVSSNLIINLVPTPSSDMPISAVKYAIYETTGTMPSAGTYLSTKSVSIDSLSANDYYLATGYTLTSAYELVSSTIAAGSSKSYYLYLWTDYYEGDLTQQNLNKNTTTNKSFDAYLFLTKVLSSP